MSRLARNILYNLGGQLALLVLGMVSAKYIYGRLGRDVLGIIYFALMLNTFAVAILQLGITATTIKEIAANERDTTYVVRIIRSGAWFYWLAYAIVAVAIFLLVPWFVREWITLETMDSETAIHLLRILGVFTLLSVPHTFYASVFRGAQRTGITNVIDVATSAVHQAGIVAIIALSGDVNLVVWWIAANYVVRILLALAVLARMYGWGALVPKLDRDVVQRTRSFTLQLAAISLLATIHSQTDKFLIASLLPVGAIGVYGLLYSTVARGGILTSAVAVSGFPALSELVAAGDRDGLRTRYHRLQDLLCFGLVPVYALIAFAIHPLLAVVLDPATAAELVVPGVLLCVGYYMNGALNVPYYLALAANRPQIVTRLNLVALITTLPVTIVLTWQLEIVGAAASWVWYHVFAFAYVVPPICRECLDLPPSAWFRHIARVVALAMATYGVVGIVIVLALTPSITTLAVGFALASAAFGIATWYHLGADSRTTLVDMLRSLRGR